MQENLKNGENVMETCSCHNENEKTCCCHKDTENKNQNPAKNDSCHCENTCHEHENEHELCHNHDGKHDDCHATSCACHNSCGCSCGEHKIPGVLEKILIACGFVLAVLGFFFMAKGSAQICGLCFVGAYVAFGANVFYGLIRQLLQGRIFSENMLMTLSSVGAIAISESMEGMLVMMLFRIGEMLEHYAEKRTGKSISDLLKLKPKTVRVKQTDGKFKISSPENLSVGDVIIVKPGEIIGADGYVCKGSGEVDTSSITGESLPMVAGEGTQVLFGYSSINSPLEICVTKAYADGTFSKIIQALKQNLEKKSASETFIARFAKIYTPIVMALAVAVAVVGGALTGDFGEWLYRALVFLALSCPCALVISVPLTFFTGLGFLSRMGLLLKGSAYIEKLAKCGICAFDKTGTLTDGKPGVAGIDPSDGFDESEVIMLAAALEKNSNHPVAKAVMAAKSEISAQNNELSQYEATDVCELPGKGMRATIDGSEVMCGNREILKLAGISEPDGDDKYSVLYVVKDGRIAGRIFINDVIRETSAQLLSGLKKLGIKTMILTGDRGASVEKCKKELLPDEIFDGLLPHEKSEILKRKMSENDKRKTCVYLGDGINDAPVIALADVGIAMGNEGADITVETADGVLMNSRPEVLLDAINLCKSIVKRAKINICIAFAVKLAVLLLDVFGMANMLLAMLADVGVMIVVVINSMRRYNK